MGDLGPCFDKFFTDLYSSYCFSEEQANNIKCKLQCSLSAYSLASAGSTGFIQIINETYQCLHPIILDSASITYTNISMALFWVLLATAIFVVLVALILIILGTQQNYGASIGLVLLMALLYLISIFIIIYVYSNTISTQITQAENDLSACVTSLNTAFNDFFNTQRTSLCAALNSYDCVICNIFSPFQCPTGTIGTEEAKIEGDFEARSIKSTNRNFVNKEYGIIER